MKNLMIISFLIFTATQAIAQSRGNGSGGGRGNNDGLLNYYNQQRVDEETKSTTRKVKPSHDDLGQPSYRKEHTKTPTPTDENLGDYNPKPQREQKYGRSSK